MVLPEKVPPVGARFRCATNPKANLHRPENAQGGEVRLSGLCFPQTFDKLFNSVGAG